MCMIKQPLDPLNIVNPGEVSRDTPPAVTVAE
jgi:hypothetical protein